MFREMRRIRQQMSEEECLTVLQREPRGVLAVLGDEDYPYTVPMDHVYQDGVLYFHCAKEGHKLDAIRRHDKVTYCVLDKGEKRDPEDWALWFRSVVVFGRIREIRDEEERIRRLRALGNKYNPSPDQVEEDIAQNAHRACILALEPEHITGKLVHEK